MAQKIQTLFIDDIDGAAAEGTVRFGLDGTEGEIDLNARHNAITFTAASRPGEGLPVCRDDEALEVVRVVREELVSVFGHSDRVGMPESADLGVVEAWLDGEHHAGLQRRWVSHVNERRLVHSKAG